jgi:hypothetical protein
MATYVENEAVAEVAVLFGLPLPALIYSVSGNKWAGIKTLV